MSEEIFFSVLKEKFPLLLAKICRKKYTLLVPLKKFITATMLNQNFYDNHIFYVCPSDPDIFINFNGKSLIYQEPDFKSYLGWKNKVIEFKYKEKVILDLGSNFGSLEYMSIDNVCDEVHFNSTVPSAIEGKPTTVKQFTSSEEYVKYYNNFAQTNADYKEAEKKLEYAVNMLKNNHILIKGYEPYYFNKFQDLVFPVIESFKSALGKVKVDDIYLTTVVTELVESLMMTKFKMSETIMDSFRSFFEEEEKMIFEKMKEMKNEYSLVLVLGPQYKDFDLAPFSAKLKELSMKRTYFEKVHVIREINNMITKAGRDIYARMNRKDKDFDSDFYLHVWSYLFSQSNWVNLISDITLIEYMSFFMSMMEANSYVTTTLMAVMGRIRDDISKNENRLSQNIKQTVIETKPIIPYKAPDKNEF